MREKILKKFEEIQKKYPEKKVYVHLAVKAKNGYNNKMQYGLETIESLLNSFESTMGMPKGETRVIDHLQNFIDFYVGGWEPLFHDKRKTDEVFVDFYLCEKSEQLFLNYDIGVHKIDNDDKDVYVLPVERLYAQD